MCALGEKRTRRLGRESTPDSADSSLQETLSVVNLEDLPLFKFEILANATDRFSDVNKLGKGGFGPVYKVISYLKRITYHVDFVNMRC